MKPRDKMKINVVKRKRTIRHSAVPPSGNIFVKAGKAVPKKILAESRRTDEAKLKRQLRELCAE